MTLTDTDEPRRRAVAAGSPVTLVIFGLVVGGAERVLTSLANGWAEAGREVTILTFDTDRYPPFFPIDPRVKVRRLGLARDSSDFLQAISNNVRRITVLRRAIRETSPSAVISFMDRTNVVTLLASVGAGWPVIVADRTAADPGSGRLWQLLRRITYRLADAIVVQTEGSRRALPVRLQSRSVAIPNPVIAQALEQAPGGLTTPEAGLVVTLGRLVPQKGYDLLIEAFARVVSRVPTARLVIWGDGPEEGLLREVIKTYGLEGSVELAGETREPARAISRGAVFVLSSRIEGFPNVLVEAMALGRPVVSVDCTFGPAEIIRDGIDGRLVPADDLQALADAIVELLEDREAAELLGQRAREIRSRFAFPGVLARWSALIDGRPSRG